MSTSGMQLALMVQPLALPHPSEEPVQVMHEFSHTVDMTWELIAVSHSIYLQIKDNKNVSTFMSSFTFCR